MLRPMAKKKREMWIDKSLLIAVAFSLSFATMIQMLPLEYSEDFDGYVDYALHSTEMLEENSEDAFTLLSNEPLWLLGNSLLYRLVDDPDVAVRIVIFLVSLLLSFAVITIDKRYMPLLIIFLFTPQMFHNFTTHVRQGVAMAIFYLAYYRLGRKYGAPAMVLTPFIHSSMFFILPLVYVRDVITSLRLDTIKSLVFLVGSFILLGAFTGVLAHYFEARQAEHYEFGSFAGSGLGLLFWVGVLSLVYWEGKRFYWKHIIGISVLILYCCIYLFVEVSGRILEAGLPLVFAMVIHFSGFRKAAFLIAFVFYFFVSWYLQIKGDYFFHGLYTGESAYW